MEEIAQIAGLILFSSLKFFLAPTASAIAGYGLIASSLICFSGGAIGFFAFYYFGSFIQGIFKRFGSRNKKKTFSKKNKLIIKVKLSFGLLGLALLTPCLFGIPLGSILASNYYSKNKKAIPVFLSSILIWSIGLSYFSIYMKLP